MRKVGICWGEWEKHISLEEVKETGKQEPGRGVANWSLGKNSSVWKNREYRTPWDEDVWLLPVGLVAQAAVPETESMLFPTEHC